MRQTRSISILLVEDDPVHARLIRRALTDQSAGRRMSIDHVSDGESALQLMLGSEQDLARFEGDGPTRPDLVLLDLRLPTIDGFDVLVALRQSDATRSVPVVVVSTSDHETDVNRSYRLGANAYVSKSPDFDELTGKMARLSEFWIQAAELPHD